MSTKEQAISLRKHGSSLRDVEKRLGVARSTLSGWFKNVEISKFYSDRLHKRWLEGLAHARKNAVKWHNEQKSIRLQKALEEAKKSLGKISSEKTEILELALAMLYLGEGFKTNSSTGLGNTSPIILNFFIAALEKLYGLNRKDFGYELHLRADQSPAKEIKFWSNTLRAPKDRFSRPALDKRTIGKPTYKNYHGVCIVQGGNVAIQRKLVYLSDLFCQKIIGK